MTVPLQTLGGVGQPRRHAVPADRSPLLGHHADEVPSGIAWLPSSSAEPMWVGPVHRMRESAGDWAVAYDLATTRSSGLHMVIRTELQVKEVEKA